jgi:anti-sigma-K factor RskA
MERLAREASEARERLRQEQDALRAELQRYAAVIELLRDPGTRVVALRGAGPASEAGARLVWHETRGGHLFVTNLPPAPEGKAYELWTITGGTPRPAGVFQTDASGKGTHAVEAAAAGRPVDVFAVTVEPAAGVASPTGPIVLASAT